MTDYDVSPKLAQALVGLQMNAYKVGLGNGSLAELDSYRAHALDVFKQELNDKYDSGWNGALEELKHRNEVYEAY